MIKKAYIAIMGAMLPMMVSAQSAIDGQQISQAGFRGTARFMSMGGAFTALGGDLTVLNQNPAGIGIYRSNEIGVTLALDFQRSSTSPASLEFPSHQNQTKFTCNNFAYVGATNLYGALRTLNWGVSYNRAASFDRVYSGYVGSISTSLSNYVASYTSAAKYPSSAMEFNDAKNYNPYLDSDMDWLSILSYSAYMINPINAAGTEYAGLYKNGTKGDALFSVRETGYVDEYDFSVGGNVENIVYWGLTLGVTDLNYTRSTYYSEYMADANIVNAGQGGPTANGDAAYDLNNRKYIKGSGFNLKLGLIVKPVNELRLGLAVHTPTWYRLNQGYDGTVDFSYYNPALAEDKRKLEGYDYTEYANFDWHYSSPWRLMAGIAGVIDNKAIISADYQYDAYPNQRVSVPVYYGGYIDSFQPDQVVNQDSKDYFQGSHTVRVGVEYRVTPQFSVRGGYNYTSSNVTKAAADGLIEVFTSGTDPSYTFDKSIQHITAGFGYKYKAWYIDLAYVYKNRESRYHAFTNFATSDNAKTNVAPQLKVSDNNSMVVLSTGIKF